MNKLKKSLKHLFAPAIVLVLVAIMGVFSPMISVAAALQLHAASVEPGVGTQSNITIENLPARNVKVNEALDIPTLSGGSGTAVQLWHANKLIDLTGASTYTYQEVGSYEWRFFVSGALYYTHTVTATNSSYTMTMPSNVVTVAPKGLTQLTLPLPSNYTVDGNTMEVAKVEVDSNNNHFATVTLKNKKTKISTTYHLSMEVALEDNTFATNKITFSNKNASVDLSDYANTTGILKVSYVLKDNADQKVLVVTPLQNIEIKNINRSDVTFANIPTAPSVSNLAYYETRTLTAPSADSAKAGKTSFAVEAQTTIAKVQAYLYDSEPSDWSKVETINVTDGVVNNDIIEIDGLDVKVKKLGYYRFQFKTSTLFGYKMDSDFNNHDAIEQDSDKTYVAYWSDTVRIYKDSVAPDFAWVDDYSSSDVATLNDNYTDLNNWDKALPMTSRPTTSTNKKITVKFEDGLTLPALFPHDNATAYTDMEVTAFTIRQEEDLDGNKVYDNTVYKSSDTNTASQYFVYDQTKHVQINFNGTNDADALPIQGNNLVTLKRSAGLYSVSVTVRETQAKFEGEGKNSSNRQTYTETYYFYVNDTDAVSPVIDESNTFQISDVYLAEGNTFDFTAPSINDDNTATNNIQIDYYLVKENGANDEIIAQLDNNTVGSTVTVDLTALHDANGNTLTVPGEGEYYIYAVARNFNGMQANLKEVAGVTDNNNNGKFFKTELFNIVDTDSQAQYGYAWKRAKFYIYDKVTNASAGITTNFNSSNVYKAGETITIDTITANWGSNAVDAQINVAAYMVKDENTLVQYDVMDQAGADAEVISSVSFYAKSKTLSGLCFTPKVSGKYILVVTSKENASDKVYTHVAEIQVGTSDVFHGNLSTVPSSMTIGDSAITLPTCYIYDDKNDLKYITKGNKLLDVQDNNNVVGYCTVTAKGVSTSSNPITGNKFAPTKAGNYKLVYECYKENEASAFYTIDCNIQVSASESSATILMGEDYKINKVLWTAVETPTSGDTSNEIAGKTYKVTEDYTESNPAYAITLSQFVDANIGGSKDFVVDSASLFQYLEPIYNKNTSTNALELTGYRYPAIAIPMPNVISDTINSDEVEITVQKNGKSDYYYVSSKSEQAGSGKNKASVIDKIDGYYVFRPEGQFSADCKTKYNKDTYTMAATNKNAATGVYTVTYTASENLSQTFTVTFGNVKTGELGWNEGFLTYDDNKNIADAADALIIDKDKNGHRYVTIDMSKVFFTGNDNMVDLIAEGPNGDKNNTDGFKNADADPALEYYWKYVSVSVAFEDGTFIDASDWSEAEGETKAIKDHNTYTYKFDLTQGSGTYKVTVKMTNTFTPSAGAVSASTEFTLDAESTNKNVNLNTVWGIILIILSVGLFAGVIFYFVKTARATRFVDAPRALKNKDKKEAPKAPVKKAEPEQKTSAEPTATEEAPKKDAK